MRGLLRTVCTATATCALVAAFVTPATAGPAVAVHRLGDAQQATTRYWTPQAMRSATPMRTLIERVGGVIHEVARGEPSVVQPVSALGSVVGGVVDGIAGLLGSGTTGAPWTGGGAVTKTTGRVFFTFNGQRASCTGSAVASQNRSVVITAGHCVKYKGTWHTNWIFVPGYHDGKAPYGTWSARVTLTTPQWESSENINYDVGAAVVRPHGGKRLTEVVGGQGIAFNQPRGQPMYAFGYPAEAPYDGSRLIYCAGDTFTDPLLSNDNALACDMTGGASGGPWFRSFDESSGTGILNSVNSFGYVFLPGYLFGPYFGSAVQNLYQRAATA